MNERQKRQKNGKSIPFLASISIMCFLACCTFLALLREPQCCRSKADQDAAAVQSSPGFSSLSNFWVFLFSSAVGDSVCVCISLPLLFLFVSFLLTFCAQPYPIVSHSNRDHPSPAPSQKCSLIFWAVKGCVPALLLLYICFFALPSLAPSLSSLPDCVF